MEQPRREHPRALPHKNYQERRRQEALKKQGTARSAKLSRARGLAVAAAAPPEDGPAARPASHTSHQAGQGRSPGRSGPQYYWADQLMLPEWLVEVPADLGSQWYVLPRPEGERCLVVASGGRTASRRRTGELMERFSSALPAGGPGSRGCDQTILDAVYHAPTQTYHVLDVMSWGGHDLYDCTAEFRIFWGHSKLEEVAREAEQQLAGSAGQHETMAEAPAGQQVEHDMGEALEERLERRFAALPAYEATPAGLRAACADAVPFARDGLHLLHRRAHYFRGQTPLALRWKDARSSRYFLETDGQGAAQVEQRVVLQYRMDRSVATGDQPPVALATMPAAFATAMGGRIKPGRLLRFRLGPGGVRFHQGQPVGAELHFEGAASQRRGGADTLSKILFQWLGRTQPITLDALTQAAAASACDGAPAEAGTESIGVLQPGEPEAAGEPLDGSAAMAEDLPP